MPALPSIFSGVADFDPNADFDAFLQRVPARWVVYLLADVDDRPVQLLCVRNLRASLKRRLGGEETLGPSRRVNYRDLVRRIHWRRVDSSFEADWLYYEAARELFPESYRGMVGFRPAWFIHVDPEAAFPRYTKTIDLVSRAGIILGPLEDKHAAARLIELTEDLFDLCRFYNLLTESPHANACAYKEMGKCPAPCDGSISLEQYRRLVDWSARTLVNPAELIGQQTRRIQQAASEMRFESAAKVKAYADQLALLGKAAFRHARLLGDFRYLSLQRGPRPSAAKLFLVTPGQIEMIAGLIREPASPSDLLRFVLAQSQARPKSPDAAGAERIGIVAHHLFLAKQSSGVFLHTDALDSKSLPKAFRDLQRQKLKEETDEEGLVKELQAL